MGFALVAFIAIFILIASAGFLLFYRDAVLQRLPRVLTPQLTESEEVASMLGRIKAPANSLGTVVQSFEKVLPKSSQEVSVVKTRLTRAGYRDESATKIFYGTKVVVPILLCIVITVVGIHTVMAYIFALGLGYLVPDFWLGKLIKKRQLNLRLGLPDVLDLLVICVEAGLSVDQATVRAAEELRVTQPELSDELGLVILEQRAGRPRPDAWRNFAERSDLDVIKELTSVLIQADQFGTSVAKNLRVYSETLRTRRRQQVEEKAAKTAVKLVFPLVLFIFPSLFVVVLAPSLLSMVKTMKDFASH